MEIKTAILAGDRAALEKLLTKSKIDKPDEEGYTPLYLACMRTAVPLSTINTILKLGASVDAKGADDETPLFIATYNHRVDVVETLLAAGANVQATNSAGVKETVLHVAARLGLTDLVATFIKRKADVNARNASKETPLFVAARAGRHDTVYLLLEAGADASIANVEEKTPLYIASEKGYKHVVIVLKASRSELHRAKAEADAELRMHPMPVMSTSQIADRARQDKLFSEQLQRRRSAEPAPPQEKMNVVDIKVPQPKPQTHDPFTGATKGPCRSLEEVGYDEPPPIPKELQNRPPAKPARVGGTSMVVQTEEGARVPVRLDSIGGDSTIEFYASPKKV